MSHIQIAKQVLVRRYPSRGHTQLIPQKAFLVFSIHLVYTPRQRLIKVGIGVDGREGGEEVMYLH